MKTKFYPKKRHIVFFFISYSCSAFAFTEIMMDEILPALRPVGVHANLSYFLCDGLPFSEAFGNRFLLTLIQHLNSKFI